MKNYAKSLLVALFALSTLTVFTACNEEEEVNPRTEETQGRGSVDHHDGI